MIMIGHTVPRYIHKLHARVVLLGEGMGWEVARCLFPHCVCLGIWDWFFLRLLDTMILFRFYCYHRSSFQEPQARE